MSHMPKKILITGSNGLLGQKLVRECLRRGLDFVATANTPTRVSFCPSIHFKELDITQREAVNKLIQEENPTHIINTAAMTNVDACEEKVEQCYAINRDGVNYLLRAIEKTDIHFIQLSTDFIFDGKRRSYVEEARANPLGEYGNSKWEAEKEINQFAHKNTTILRTSLLYGVGENLKKGNIFSWAMQQLREGKELTIVDDQYRTPTFVEDLVTACFLVIDQAAYGIYNIAGKEIHSMFYFIVQLSKYLQVDPKKVKPISSDQLNQKANRPPSSGLCITKAVTELGYHPTDFVKTLKAIDPRIGMMK